MEDDLNNEGYWNSKEQYEKEISGDYDDEEDDWEEDEHYKVC